MGRFTLRLPETLHLELEAQAKKEGVSLNQYIVYALTRQVAGGYSVQVTPKSFLNEQRDRYETLLHNLGEPSDVDTESFLSERAESDSPLPDELVTEIQRKFKDKG